MKKEELKQIKQRLEKLENKVFGKGFEPAFCEGCDKLLAYYIKGSNRIKTGTIMCSFVGCGVSTKRKGATALWCRKCERKNLG